MNGNLAADIVNSGEVLRALNEALKPFSNKYGYSDCGYYRPFRDFGLWQQQKAQL